jgi:hypothetical protein
LFPKLGFKPAGIGEARASGRARANRPDPAANIREIFAVILQLLVCASVPSISKKAVPGEGRTQWHLGPKRGLLVDASVMEPMFLVPANRSIARQPHMLNLGMKSRLRNVHRTTLKT